TGHTGQVNSVVFLPHGESLVSGSSDGMVRQWDLRTTTLKGAVNGQVGAVLAVAFNGPSKRLAMAGDGVRIRLSDGTFLSLHGHQGPVLCVAFSPDGKLVATGGSDGTVRVWQPNSGKELCCCTDHSGAVNVVVFAADGQAVYSGGADGALRRS